MNSIISIEPHDEIKAKTHNKGFKKGYYLADSLAIFERKSEAVAFREGNTDWVVVPCFVSLTPTLHA